MRHVDPHAHAVTGSQTWIAPAVLRIVAPNPSPLTGPGTNTYLVGRDHPVVIDPGPAEPEHIEAILAAADGRVREIFCTHSHTDHSPGAALLAERTGARVRGLPAPDDDYQDPDYSPEAGFEDGEVIAVDDEILTALHTPGHASNHVCFLLESAGLLFTGDHLMSGSTVVILPPDGSMRQYVASLHRLLTLPIRALAPGHGAVIPDAHKDIGRVIAHRLRREEKLVLALAQRGEATLDDVLAQVYDDVPPFMHPVAKHSLLAHAIKLAEEGRARHQGERWTWLGP